MKKSIRKILPDLVVLFVFVVLSFSYFVPSVLQGRVLTQGDASAGIGAGQEAKVYYQDTGRRTRWSNAIFGGMPTYQTSPSYPSTDTLRHVEHAYSFGLPNYVYLVFILLLGFYILLRALKLSPMLSLFGAIIWAFSSYFFIIIAAGHIWKFVTLAYIPPTLAGMILAYRGKYLLGGLLTALFASLQIFSNHVQMTYYFLFLILLLVIAYGVEAYQSKQLRRFFIASGSLFVAALLAVAINSSSLYHTYSYSKLSMRGKSELVKQNTANQSKDGLDRDYITQWSYGIGETFSLLIPNIKGGASVPLMKNELAAKKANPLYKNIYNQLGQYWGEQPGTSGPVYVGAFVLFLFIFSLFIVKGPMKWALLFATLLSITLSWGKNFMGFTNFFIDYVPLYDKFRAVSSILVVAEFTIPFLAVLGLHKLLSMRDQLDPYKRYFHITILLTAGVSLLFALFPGLFFAPFLSTSELAGLRNGLPAEHYQAVVENLGEMRKAILTADAWRSLAVLVIGIGLLYGWMHRRLSTKKTIVAITLLCLVDMWMVNKRYLNDAMFTFKHTTAQQFQQTATDKAILADSALDYRVANLSLCRMTQQGVNSSAIFNDNRTSYWHKSIGGYHAAKLRRYQDLIEHHLSPEIDRLFQELLNKQGDFSQIDGSQYPALNMLNTLYCILPVDAQRTAPLKNPYACGNAWFVDSVRYVSNANEEIAAISAVAIQKVAIVGADFQEQLPPTSTLLRDSLASVHLLSYAPNELVYETSNQKEGIVVFSEIYYPGWRVTIDGKAATYGRANYLLRAMQIPAGKHRVAFTYDPVSLHVTEGIAWTALILLLLAGVVVVIRYNRRPSTKKP